MAITGQQIADEVTKFLHDPYVYGAAGPSSFDCSGLVQYVLATLGVKNVPRTSEAQWAWTQHITQGQLQPGDLVFSQWPGDNASPGHVGVYAGNGQIIAADNPSAGVQRDTLASWAGHIVGYGRVPGAAAGGCGGGGGGGSGLWPTSVTGAFSTLDSAVGGLWSVLTALLSPSTYVRAAAGIAGGLLLVGGVWFLIKAAT